ncbi:MAG: sigma-70 family RNA polymerase sigma factor [Verrucomicrobia bacterium]|nr:sigma-70 family RNA polymerase sigma factor [Verrucomicrobiota bacterium]
MREQQARFEELVLPHLDAAYRLARLLVKRDEDAQDIVQDAYIKALKGFEKFRGGNARAWILMIVRNTAYTWLKRHQADKNVIPFDEAVHQPPTEEVLPESSHEERLRQFREALAKLPVEFREILVLRDIEGWSYKQLASALKLPAGTVMSRLNRARQHLREELAKVQTKESSNEV